MATTGMLVAVKPMRMVRPPKRRSARREKSPAQNPEIMATAAMALWLPPH